jgi:hypothetical protein
MKVKSGLTIGYYTGRFMAAAILHRQAILVDAGHNVEACLSAFINQNHKLTVERYHHFCL